MPKKTKETKFIPYSFTKKTCFEDNVAEWTLT